MIIGKLKKTTSEKCPKCNRSLQIRAQIQSKQIDIGVVAEKELLFICCPSCDYSEVYNPLKQGKKKNKNKWR